MSRTIKRTAFIFISVGILCGIIIGRGGIPTKNVFDEIFFAGRNELSFAYLRKQYRVEYSDNDGGNYLEPEIKSWVMVTDKEGGREVYVVVIDEYWDNTMDIYTQIRNRDRVFITYTYEYDARKKTLRPHIWVSDPEGQYEKSGETLKTEAKVVLDEFIREFIRNNEGKTRFIPEDWGEYGLLEEYIEYH